MDEEEIKKELQPQGIIAVKRISIRYSLYVLTIKGQTIPKRINIGYLKKETRPYIPNSQRCFQFWTYQESSIGRVFRSLLRRRRKMAALPLPVAILDDLISDPQMRSSKMATGSGRAAILRRRRNRGRKTRPRFWMTSFPASPSWIQDGGGGNDVWRTSRRS